MMGNLIKAEFRKTLSLKTWWVLLIPLALVAFWLTFAWGKITNDFADFLSSDSDARQVTRLIGLDPSQVPVGLLALAHGVNIAQLVPGLFGIFALAGEYRSKTITTTFLTAPNRISALTAKMLTYVGWGAIYGLVSFGVSAIAVMSSVDSGRWPSAGQWLAALGGTILASVLVTLFGIGFGAVLRNVPLAVVLFLVWFLIVENVLVILLWGQTTLLGGILPNGTANGIVGGIAADAFGFNSLNLPDDVNSGAQLLLQYTAAAPGVLSWWASALIFFAWTMLFFGLGWAGNQKRDIT
ncbi:Efflux ABC transporter [Amycolatopsis camponoti]|uniref:Efflux ABC transporter n=2 Tax=Pseudonocardiaceae TaxID=2070 RepID=A0A6I8LFP8_9PSEU|nr:Efflux ABC transporter [Amycolatopsis camponoti]